MSEYQSYEFVALERPLTQRERAELRAVSTRAEISPTRFWNEYQWGDLKAEPEQLMARHFDAHLYFANWGTHRLMLRLPKARVDLEAMKPNFGRGCSARLRNVGDHVLLDFVGDTEAPEEGDGCPVSLAALAPLRAELMRGDLRPAYLAWLLSAGAGDVAGDRLEPPVPPGLAALTAPQAAMVEFLRIDGDLLAAASAGRAAEAEGDDAIQRWERGNER